MLAGELVHYGGQGNVGSEQVFYFFASLKEVCKVMRPGYLIFVGLGFSPMRCRYFFVRIGPCDGKPEFYSGSRMKFALLKGVMNVL